MQTREEIRELVKGLGAQLCGFAAAEDFADAPEGFRPRDLWAGARTVIVLGVALPKGLYAVKPDLIYAYFNMNSCPLVDAISFRAAAAIEAKYDAVCVPLPGDGPCGAWDPKTLSAHGLISVKHAAVRAGLGTLGKNTLLLNREFGNRLTLGAILTDLSLPGDEAAASICPPKCHLCLDSCPVGALDGTAAAQNLCRPQAYGSDPRGFPTVRCNLCRTICPMRNGSGNRGAGAKTRSV